jgi:type IV pilus assembly protein PilV
MIEALISMFLIAMWMLSSAGLHFGILKYQKSSEYRLVAISLASELAERMEANLDGAVAGHYTLLPTSSAVPAGSDCADVDCSPSLIAAYDLSQWSGRASTALVLEAISVTDVTPAGGLRTYNIAISWKEPRGRRGSASGSTEAMSYVTTKVVRNAS